MLIKVTRGLDHSRNFTLFDSASSVECLCPIHFDDSKALYQWLLNLSLPADEVHHVVHEKLRWRQQPFSEETVVENFRLSRSTRYSISAVLFAREGKRHVVFFDGEAFICTNDGKTLERITAGGLYEDCDVAA